MTREYTRNVHQALLACPAAGGVVLAIPYNPDRVYAMIQSTGTGAVAYGFDSSVTFATGMLLRADTAVGAGNGGMVSLPGYTGDIYVFGADANSVVRTVEVG